MNNRALTLFLSLAIASVPLSNPPTAIAQGVDNLKRGVVKITAQVVEGEGGEEKGLAALRKGL